VLNMTMPTTATRHVLGFREISQGVLPVRAWRSPTSALLLLITVLPGAGVAGSAVDIAVVVDADGDGM
jgi:hypothetical protein